MTRLDDTPLDAPQGLPLPDVTVAGRVAFEDWKTFFSAFSHIVLIANSEEQTVDAMQAAYPDTALFVFFNKVDRVLSAPFAGRSLLVTRSNQAGSELVYRGILGRMTAYLPAPGFTGVASLRTVAFERRMEIAEFGETPAGIIDLASYFEGFYPADHTPSSGFALALWLCELLPGARVVLNGFSAKRSDSWKLFHIHDWTFEQSVLQLLEMKGKLVFAGRAGGNPYQELARRFPDIPPTDIAFATLQVLSRRLENSNRDIDRLISMTGPLRFLYNASRALKRKSKKDRILAKRDKQGG
jgi:hypothetical protein